jgi:cytochrome c peroxidase
VIRSIATRCDVDGGAAGRRLLHAAARLAGLGTAAGLGLLILGPGTLFGSDAQDGRLRASLQEQRFTGRIEQTLTARLGRSLDPRLANIGRLLWFDTVTGLNGDNSCAGCHSPTNGFGDSQPIAIGIDNNGIVGPDRRGPCGARRWCSTRRSFRR